MAVKDQAASHFTCIGNGQQPGLGYTSLLTHMNIRLQKADHARGTRHFNYMSKQLIDHIDDCVFYTMTCRAMHVSCSHVHGHAGKAHA